MFFHVSMRHNVILHPRYFGSDLFQNLTQKLHSEIEGTCCGRYGFVIAITAIEEVGSGLLLPSDGFVEYPMKFKAIVFRPFKSEVLDGIVTQVNKVGIFVEVGPLSCFISRLSMPLDLQFCMIDDEPHYRTNDEEMIIGFENKVRFKLIGIRIEASGIFGVGSLMDDYLGAIA